MPEKLFTAHDIAHDEPYFEDANIKVFAQENAHFYFRRKPSKGQAQIIFIPI